MAADSEKSDHEFQPHMGQTLGTALNGAWLFA